ncbi:MAG: V-type ATP synthase subunit I, partial [Planctomycetota bacterium]
HQHEVEVMLGYWEGEREKVEARNNALDSQRITVLTGFLPEKERKIVDSDLKEQFPGISTVYRDPEPDDDVPVSLTHSRLMEPVTFLVDMFGLPDYFSFDPTPFLAFSFLLFFGMCFADVFYGLALTVVGYLLARKMRPHEGMYNLCMLFCYAGVFTTVLGVISGGWASTLWEPEYLGEGNILMVIRNHTTLVGDLLDQAVLLLVISIGIGVVNQFYGLILRAYGSIRRGKVLDALYDSGLWFLVLPGFLIAFGSLFFDMSSSTLNVGIGLMIVGGIGLILTQGRDADGAGARFGKGVISIYGIMGSYGCITFLSDILSYSRLVALGLTSSIVGMAFNIIAELVRSTPVVGVVLFVLILVFGHTFNFLVSMLAAFVHPARLIFLEFFNCFYEGGGTKFRPLSVSTESVIVKAETRS